MINSTHSFLKYEEPVISNIKKPVKVEYPTVSPRLPTAIAVSCPLPPPPKPTRPPDDVDQQTEDILHTILTPKKWMENNEVWVQQVSCKPSTRTEVIELTEKVNVKLQQGHAKDVGVCPVRRELYTQCFDELIRQVTLDCAERGLLLSQVRDEILMTIAAYEAEIKEGSTVFAMLKATQAKKIKTNFEKKIAEFEKQKKQLERKLHEEKMKLQTLERLAEEQRKLLQENHKKRTQTLHASNQQLKNHLDWCNVSGCFDITAGKK